MAISFNTNPYYDDFDLTKGFHRILFKPGVAVQARELTQLQTILQNQIKQFGDHIFVDGTLVIPGQSAYDNKYHSVKVVENTNPSTDFIGEIVVGGTTGVKALVVNATLEGDGDPSTLYVKYLNSGTNGTTSTFADSETITIEGGSEYVTAESSSACATGSAFTITAGVMYIRGNFVYFPQQTYIINKYAQANDDVIIGFDIDESILSYEDDFTLVDPAQGTYNYSAPGADRYYIGLTLAERGLTPLEADEENFLELIRIENGIVISQKNRTQYNYLADELARRTYDESGDYVVRPYNLKLLEHLRTSITNGFYNSVDGGNSNKIIAKIEPGKAYVKGYEVDSTKTMVIPIDKARDTQSVNSGSVFLPIGNYALVDNVIGIPTTIETCPLISLYDTAGGTGSVIGAARLRFLEYSSGTVGDPGAQYRAYLFDVTMNSGEVFADVRSIYYTNFVADLVLESGDAVIKETKNSSYIFPMPRSYIESFVDNETTYSVRKLYSGTLDGSSAIQIIAPANTSFASYSTDNYQMICSDPSHNGDYLDLSTASFEYDVNNTVLDITLSENHNGHSVYIIATLNKSNSAANKKSKILNSNQVIDKLTQAACEASTITLGKADIYRLVSVKMTTAGAFGDGSYNTTSEIDITSRYTLDNGQRASHYALGSIKLKKGQPKPTAPIRITYDYFSHGVGDYFSVDSYATIDYADIPTVTLDGTDYVLRDCLDFRPRINDAGTDYTGTGASVGAFPDQQNDLTCDYSFYLPKITKIAIDSKGLIQVIDGKSELNPKEPETPRNAMALYVLNQDPYVLDIDDNIKIFKVDNRRYTMRDIGKLETRIKNVEYYVSLNLLELDTQQYQIQDGAGNDLFKNGFVVDSFSGHGVGDVYNTDYGCAIDMNKRELRPLSDSHFLKCVEINTDDTARTADNYKLVGDLILLNHTEEAFISNTKTSEALSLNPYSMVTYVGIINGKTSDIWFEYNELPTVYVNENGNYDSILSDAQAKGTYGTVWGSWQNFQYGNTDGSTTTGQKREGTVYSVQESIDVHTENDVLVSTDVIPKMRDVAINFSAEGLKPTTRLYVFFNGINVTRDCKPITGSNIDVQNAIQLLGDSAEDLITDTDGMISVVFNYSAAKYNLNTGKYILRLTDSPTGNIADESTSASMLFTSTGELKNVQDRVVSTRNAILTSATIDDERNVKITIEDNGGSASSDEIDPIIILDKGQVYIEPIVSAPGDPVQVDHSGYLENMFLYIAGRYPNDEELALMETAASKRGITDTTVTNATTSTELIDTNGEGGIDVVNGTTINVPSSYNDDAEKLFFFTKDVATYVLKNDLAEDNNSSGVVYVKDTLDSSDEQAASVVALQTVIATTNSSSLSSGATYKDAAVSAKISL